MTSGAPSTSPEVPGSGLACSAWARLQNLDPVGTAGSYRGFLLIEWPLPWPRDLSEDESLATVLEAARSFGMRLQGLVPATESGPRRAIAYRWPPAGGARFQRSELVVDPGELVAAAVAVLHQAPLRDEIVDVLVCTHGRRDRCCGSLGTALFQELTADPGLLGQGVRVWRTSHTGGHRFAPTAIVLPEGTAWAFCDTAALADIVQQKGALGDLLPRYRGCSGMATPALQALERAVLAELGWPLFTMTRATASNSVAAGPSLSSRVRRASASYGKGSFAWPRRFRFRTVAKRSSSPPRPNRSWSSRVCDPAGGRRLRGRGLPR